MSSLLVSLVQTHLFWEDKAANLAMLEAKILGIVEKTELVVLPEMFSTGFSMQPQKLAETMEGETLKWMKKLAAQKKVILAGSLMISDEGKYFNRFLWVLPDGTLGYYDKRHLFAFAGEDSDYTAGKKRMIVSVKGWKINLQVCYDLRFPVWARQEAGEKEEYDILLYVANWPERRSHAWKTLLTARAIENQCYVVGVNRIGMDGKGIHYSGDSRVIDALGTTIIQHADVEGIFTIELLKEPLLNSRNQFPFWKDGDVFKIMHFDGK